MQPIGEVRFIAPSHFDASLDVLILPNGPGINPNLPCFIHGNYAGIPSTPMCPFLERFRVETLDQYIDAEINVVGLGDAAAILWDKLGGKCAIAANEITLLYNPTIKATPLGRLDFSMAGFKANNLAGFTLLNSDFSNLLRELKQEILDEVNRIADTSEDNKLEDVLM